jgi:hypothetical protein
MQYNTTRTPLTISEYGRGVQNLIQIAKELPTKEERNKACQSIIDLMAHLAPAAKDSSDYKQKLWTHLFVIAGGMFDVECPYDVNLDDYANKRPDRMPYPQQRIKLRHYGKVVERMIEAAMKTEDDGLKNTLSESIGNFMKMAYTIYHQTAVSDEEINADLRELSNGELALKEGVVLPSHRVPSQAVLHQQSRKNGGPNQKNKNFKKFGRKNNRY